MQMPLDKELGKKIKYLRMKNKYSKRTLADLMEVSIRTIDRWESGKFGISENNILRACEIFEVSINFFFSGTDMNRRV